MREINGEFTFRAITYETFPGEAVSKELKKCYVITTTTETILLLFDRFYFKVSDLVYTVYHNTESIQFTNFVQ